MEGNVMLDMNWDALVDDYDDDDRFFETLDRLSVVSFNVPSSGSVDDEDFDAPRVSFASAISSASTAEFRNHADAASGSLESVVHDYNVWIALPGSVRERRKRLLHCMGLSSKRELLRGSSKDLKCEDSHKIENGRSSLEFDGNRGKETKPGISLPQRHSPRLVRSRSTSNVDAFFADNKRREELLGAGSKQQLTRVHSLLILPHGCLAAFHDSSEVSANGCGRGPLVRHSGALASQFSKSQLGAFFLIKNLDTGGEFIVNEYDEDGMWNRLSDLQTGKQLTMEEFEKYVGHSPVVKELLRRESASNLNGNEGNERKISTHSYISRSLKVSKRRGAALLKNIKEVAYSVSMNSHKVDKERDNHSSLEQKPSKSFSSYPWIKVKQTGKSYKELSAMHLCQEIQAHQGSIWTIRFSLDARYLASGGEDRIVHIWEVQGCEIMSLNEGHFTQLSSSTNCSSPSLAELMSVSSDRKKVKGSSSRKCNQVPEYVHVPENLFSLLEKPVCSFTGHLDDILDLSWSPSQLLLSSSMDKTVRMWDMETKSCLKLFAHNDYVTCIQFNPVDDNYFISGSLDAKIRVWSVPDRRLVDWINVHEMVTAVSYTPDGQGALIGSHKGSCRMYDAKDFNLSQANYVDILSKKRSHAKKVTGFQFSSVNPSEVLVTSADSQIRIVDGEDVVQKFRGYKNVNSQISASFCLDGKYVVSASEDSHVYVWKRGENDVSANRKGKGTINTRSYECFHCRDVSAAIPWPGTIKGEPLPPPPPPPPPQLPPPPQQLHPKRHSKRSSMAHPSSLCISPAKDQPARGNTKREFSGSPKREEEIIMGKCKTQLPPLSKGSAAAAAAAHHAGLAPAEEESSSISHSDSSICDSFTSKSSSIGHDSDCPSISANSSLPLGSRPWSDPGSRGSHHGRATAWGLVILAATLDGEIRAYQNLGLPHKVGRQANLF